MRNKTIIILLILKNFSFSQEDIGGGLHSEELINYLYNNYKTNSFFILGSKTPKSGLIGLPKSPKIPRNPGKSLKIPKIKFG